ncbi:MAG: glycoside hydrolase family 99-like domain-containing protein [Thermoguttaceae bacterium]|nr:glycoside hydrolase family 99-like domain-containing protein [Thermoguttaceae bacterium]
MKSFLTTPIFLTFLSLTLPFFLFPSLQTETRAEETVLYSWDFETPGDLEGWRSGGGLEKLRIENGALKGTYVSRDPILFLPPVDFAVRPGLVVDVRMKADLETQGELYFTNTTEGPYGGFSGSKMTKWHIAKGNAYRTVRIHPSWISEKKIIQLRLDPGSAPQEMWGKTSFAIDSVKIIDLNFEKIQPVSGIWDFTDANVDISQWSSAGSAITKPGNGGWELRFHPDDPGIRTPQLRSVPMRIEDGVSKCWCTIEMSAEGPGMAASLTLTCEELSEPLEVSFALQPDGKTHLYNLLIVHPKFDPSKVFQAILSMTDPQTRAVVRSIRFTSSPQGPAQIQLGEGGGLTDALCRAGRPVPFEFRITNSGGETAENLTLTGIQLPDGVSLVSGNVSDAIPQTVLEPFDSAVCSLKLQAEKAVCGNAVVQIRYRNAPEAQTVTEKFTFPLEFLPSLNLPRADYVPKPRPLKSEYEIGALYFPGWGSPAAWERIFPVAPIRKPVLGWYDEADPECIDWQIKWAVENGISYFLVDWYWNRGNQHLDHWVKGFQKARYRSYLKWAMMWANHNGPGSHSEEDQAEVTRFWIENYFRTPEYYRIDGKPVVMIWSPDGMDRDVREIYREKGVELKKGEGVKKLLDLSREMARDAGFPGIYFIAMKWPEASTSPGDIQWLADAGFDMTSLYHYMHHGGLASDPKFFSFDCCVESILPYWEARQETGILPFLPNLSTGWDPRPWHGLKQTVIYGRTADKFRKICEKCREFTQRTGQRNIVLAPLNEWGEGSYAEPNKEFGFEMYEAVRETFCERPSEGWPPNYTPSDVGLGPYDFDFRRPDTQAAMNADFDDADAPRIWNAMMGISTPECADGKFTFLTKTRDPAIQARFENLLSKRCSRVVVRMKLTPKEGENAPQTDRAQLFWGTANIPQSEATSLICPIVLDGKFREYVFAVGESKAWQGVIESLRFDPCSTKDVKVEIDFIRLEK